MNNPTMTKEEILSFQGHEFIYTFDHEGDNNDFMPAYIKKLILIKTTGKLSSILGLTEDQIKNGYFPGCPF